MRPTFSLVSILPITALLLNAAPATAQPYPSKPIRMITAQAGGGSDVVSRLIAQGLTERWGRQVVVDNRPGASTMIGGELVARAAPDGYTLLMGGNSLAINPATFKKIPFDAQRDFAPITQVMLMPNLLVSHPSLPARDLRELIALTRARPGQLLYATAGHGSNPHLMMELYASMAKVRMLHVPYKGSGQSIVDLIGGHVHLDFDAVPPVINHVRQGKLRALAVTSAKRFSLLPDMPTVEESGVPGFDMSTWWGIVAPAAVSKDIINRLHTEMVKAIRQPDAKEKISGVGADIVGNTPEEFAAFIRTETEKYARIVKAANIKID